MLYLETLVDVARWQRDEVLGQTDGIYDVCLSEDDLMRRLSQSESFETICDNYDV